MSVPAAFIGVVLIWSTTPLAIQWSSEGWGYLFGVSGRMALGALVCAVLLLILKPGLPWHREARRTYLAAAVGIYGAMISVYWGAQFIPSGLLAVFYGLNPLFTGLMAAVWLREQSLTPGKLAGMAAAFAGLVAIFGSDIMLEEGAWWGAMAVIASVVLHNFSAVWVKRVGAGLPALTVNSGGLFIAVPLFVVTWALADGSLPVEPSPRAGFALLYLGVFGTALGFSLYYYLLKHVEAGRVALIPLITPVFALMLGQVLNGEQIPHEVYLGSALIILGLALHVWGDKGLGRLFPVRVERG